MKQEKEYSIAVLLSKLLPIIYKGLKENKSIEQITSRIEIIAPPGSTVIDAKHSIAFLNSKTDFKLTKNTAKKLINHIILDKISKGKNSKERIIMLITPLEQSFVRYISIKKQ